jgi:ParB family chromosome partitioning protein
MTKNLNKVMSGLSLDSIGDLSGLLNEPESGKGGARPLELDILLIDEDPNQPRTVFDRESLAEMAATICERGVKTPISVRSNPAAKGRYIINHGARRYRASKLVGKTTIPSFIDPDYTEADQIIENLQRDGLTPREIADFIGRELAKGKKKGEIAKAIGKSPAFVTQHVTLLDLPDPIAEVFNSGRCRDVTVINELVTVHKKRPKEVANWLDDENLEITRGAVKLLREFLDKKEKAEQGQDDEQDDQMETYVDEDNGKEAEAKKKAPREADPDKLKKAIVQVKYEGRTARLILNRRPSAEGYAWLKYEDGGHEFEAELAQVQLVALLEG